MCQRPEVPENVIQLRLDSTFRRVIKMWSDPLKGLAGNQRHEDEKWLSETHKPKWFRDRNDWLLLLKIL